MDSSCLQGWTGALDQLRKNPYFDRSCRQAEAYDGGVQADTWAVSKHGWIYGRSLTVVVRLAGPVGKPYMVSSPEHGALVQ